MCANDIIDLAYNAIEFNKFINSRTGFNLFVSLLKAK